MPRTLPAIEFGLGREHVPIDILGRSRRELGLGVTPSIMVGEMAAQRIARLG